MCSGCWASDSPKTPTSPSWSSNDNRTSLTFDRKKLPAEPDKGNGPIIVESCATMNDGFRSSNLVFSSLSYSPDLLSRSILPSSAGFTSMSTQSYERTPLTQILPQLYL